MLRSLLLCLNMFQFSGFYYGSHKPDRTPDDSCVGGRSSMHLGTPEGLVVQDLCLRSEVSAYRMWVLLH